MPNDIMQILDPQTAADQIALQRRMAFADALRQQSMQPLSGTDAIGGVAIQKSPLEGIAKMFQGYSANKINQQTDADRKAMATRQAQYYSALLGGGTTNPDVASSAALTSGALQGDVGPTNSNAARMDNMMAQGNGTAPQSNYGLSNLMKARLVEELGGSAMAGAFADQYKPTNEMKNAAWMGQDPRLLGALDTAAKRKAGIIEYQPGTTSQDLVTGQTRFQPKVGEGIDFNNGTASQIPGYAPANASIQGAQAAAVTGAQEAGKAPYADPIVLQGAGAGGSNVIVPRVNAPGLNGAINTITPAEAKINDAKAAAASNAQKVIAAAGPLLSTINEAKSLVNTTSSGPYGLAETKEGLANLPVVGNPKTAAANARWEQLMGQLTLSGIASSGLGRMDIPIVNAIKAASEVNLGMSPAAKLAKLNQLEKAIRDHVASVQNEVSGLNQPGITATTNQVPMTSFNGQSAQSITHPQYPGFSIAR